MPRIAYVNGRYVPHRAAAVHVEDRGYQFADGVYEVCAVHGGRLIDERRHMERLKRSLAELAIRWPMRPSALAVVLREVVRLNRIDDGIVYLQITRGVAPRDHAFPRPDVRPALVVTARAMPAEPRHRAAEKGVAVITVPDIRWARVDIKTVGLLPNVLAKEQGRAAGAYETWFVDRDGFVTEGTSTNAWIVSAGGVLTTRPADSAILWGVTRAVLLDIVRAEGLRLEERAFSVAEAYAAQEAFLTSATNPVTPVVKIDGRTIGKGKPGPVALRLRRTMLDAAEMSEL
ncbi:MAG: D-amino-acid transaminase [Bauldia sp.]